MPRSRALPRTRVVKTGSRRNQRCFVDVRRCHEVVRDLPALKLLLRDAASGRLDESDAVDEDPVLDRIFEKD